jgi:hypothetical protein
MNTERTTIGEAHAATTLNWVELLVRYRGWMSARGARGEPRRTGYEYNLGEDEARAADVIQVGRRRDWRSRSRGEGGQSSIADWHE